MNFKYLIIACLLLFNQAFISAQEPLTAIDRQYLASVVHFYEMAEHSKNEVWEGMELAPVCLFRIDGPAFLYKHPNPPGNFIQLSDELYVGKQRHLELFGATQVEINGVLTAIVDYGASRYSCTDEAYAELFHELHHVYQRNNVKQIGFDNPAVLLNYPENHVNDGIKLYEQKLLFSMCFNNDEETFRHLLNQFYSCRLMRGQIIGDYLNYEKTVENMEGPAFYSEYKFYNRFTSVNGTIKDNYNQKHFFGILTTPLYGRNNLRTRHLASGMAMCIILDKKYDNWQKEYYSKNESLYDFFISKFKPQEETIEIDSMYFKLSRHHTGQEILKHQASLNNFNAQQGIKIQLHFNHHPQFEGFDPMNAESLNDSIILHKTMLRLSSGKHNSLFVTNNKVLTIVDGEIWKVKKVVFFAAADSITIREDKISVDINGKTITWSGTPGMKTGKEIIFNCM